MGAYGEHSSRLPNFEGFKLVTNLKETKEAKCNVKYDRRSIENLNRQLYIKTSSLKDLRDINHPEVKGLMYNLNL